MPKGLLRPAADEHDVRDLRDRRSGEARDCDGRGTDAARRSQRHHRFTSRPGVRDRDTHIASTEQTRRDMLHVHIGRSVGLHADRPKPVGRVLGQRRRCPDADEKHLSRVRDRLHRLLEPIVIDGSNAFSHGVRRSGEHLKEHGAHRVRVGDVAMVKRLGPDLAGQGQLKVAIPAESQSLAAADHGRRRGLRAPSERDRRGGHRGGRVAEDRAGHPRVARRQRRQEASDPGEDAAREARR